MKVVQSCLTLFDPTDCIIHGILQARILECVAFPFSKGSSQPRDQTQVSHNCRQILYQLSCKALKSLSSTLIRKHQFFCSQPFLVKLSHQYMTTGKTVALTGWTFVNKAMSLLFNVLSRRVIAFFPRSKRL